MDVMRGRCSSSIEEGALQALFFYARFLIGVGVLKKFIILLSVLIIASASSAAYASPKRIISLTPVGTEILYALGQGNNIIGVTTFCDYPPEAAKKPKIGGYVDISLESLLEKKVDLLVLSDLHLRFKNDLERLHIPHVFIMQGNIKEIYKSIEDVGAACGEVKRAAKIVSQMKSDIASVKAKAGKLPKKKALLCVSRELSDERVSVFYAAGKGTFYDELLGIAGGDNVMGTTRAQYPKVTAEGLTVLAPDVIIDMVGERQFYHAMEKIDIDKIFNDRYLKGQWLRGVKVKATQTGQVYILQGTAFLRPGPRLKQILVSFARALHPEVKW